MGSFDLKAGLFDCFTQVKCDDHFVFSDQDFMTHANHSPVISDPTVRSVTQSGRFAPSQFSETPKGALQALLSIISEFLREFGTFSRDQQFCLRNPLIAFDSAGETAQSRIDPRNILIAPFGDLGERGDALLFEKRNKLGAEPLDLAQVIRLA